MDFTQDWFTSNIGNFEHAKKVIPDNKKFLEIGSFEGRSTVWMLENMLAEDGDIVCVDTFGGGIEHAHLNLTKLRDTFERNVTEARKESQEIRLLEMNSDLALSQLIKENEQFDFIYVDGSHELLDVLTDAVMAFKVLKKGGVMLFDDYGGGQDVRKAVDLFLIATMGLCTLLCCNYQLAIQKT
jgi:predicted O-methyltransferase YrrM